MHLFNHYTSELLRLNKLTRRKSGPIETALSGHASAILRVILTKETLCVAWLLFFHQH